MVPSPIGVSATIGVFAEGMISATLLNDQAGPAPGQKAA
jgi:hypothetical protein